MNEFLLWFMKPLADLAWFLIVLLLIALYVGIRVFVLWLKERKCDHSSFYETSACDAVCRKCGKDLGFIQPWREKFPKGELR